jgi:hypothetical protein
MTGAEVIQRLKATKDRREIAQGSGVPYSTVTKIAAGVTKNPRNDSIDALRAYFLASQPKRGRTQ